MSKRVEVWLDETSEPIVHEFVKSTYTKGYLYCVYCENGVVHKYPIMRMFRSVEDYGTHAGGAVEKRKDEK